MLCDHLQQLYDLCVKNDLKLSSSDAIRVLCKECSKTEVCPSILIDEYDSRDAACQDAKKPSATNDISTS